MSVSDNIKNPLIQRGYRGARNHLAVEGAEGVDYEGRWVAALCATRAELPAYTGAAGQLTADNPGVLIVDGVVCEEGFRILVKDEVDQTKNGLWMVVQTGNDVDPWILERTHDANADADFSAGKLVRVIRGLNNRRNTYALAVSGPVTVGTTPLEFTNIGFEE